MITLLSIHRACCTAACTWPCWPAAWPCWPLRPLTLLMHVFDFLTQSEYICCQCGYDWWVKLTAMTKIWITLVQMSCIHPHNDYSDEWASPHVNTFCTSTWGNLVNFSILVQFKNFKHGLFQKWNNSFWRKTDLCITIQMSNMQNLFWNIPGTVIANSKQYDSIGIII